MSQPKNLDELLAELSTTSEMKFDKETFSPPDRLDRICQAMRKNPMLQKLDFSWCDFITGNGNPDHFGNAGNHHAGGNGNIIQALVDSFPVGLVKLRFIETQLGEAGFKALGDSFPPNLKELLLYQVAVSETAVESLFRLRPKNLAYLTLIHNPLGEEMMKGLIYAMPPNLLFLNFDSNNIGDAGVALLARCLPPWLMFLDLTSNMIGPDGARVLAETLPRNLINLNLTGNSIGDLGVRFLVNYLPPTLSDLELENNSIGDPGAKILAEKLPSSLTSLDVSKNRIGDVGISALARAIAKSAKMQSLRIQSCDFTQIGRRVLAQSILLGRAPLSGYSSFDFDLFEVSVEVLLDCFIEDAKALENRFCSAEMGPFIADKKRRACLVSAINEWNAQELLVRRAFYVNTKKLMLENAVWIICSYLWTSPDRKNWGE